MRATSHNFQSLSLSSQKLALYRVDIMALKIVLPALLLLLVCCASEAQGQGDDTSLPLSYNATELQGDGATCPNDQLIQETMQDITSDVRNLLQNSALPFLNITTQFQQCPCISGGGTRVANLDMTNPSQQCPPAWTLITSPRRSCGRTSNAFWVCESVNFPTNGITYSQVCGRIKAYQVGQTDAFWGFNHGGRTSINSNYVTGVSITHGTPRQHVWSFAAAYYEQYSSSTSRRTCPCTNINSQFAATIQIPPFVGDDYFCETGSVTVPSTGQFLSADPLWDGEGCGPTSTCCELNNPPWFCKQLQAPTSDDIEVRLCSIDMTSNENVAIEQLELYVA